MMGTGMTKTMTLITNKILWPFNSMSTEFEYNPPIPKPDAGDNGHKKR